MNDATFKKLRDNKSREYNIIKCICAISHSLMMNQIESYDQEFKMITTRFPGVTYDEFAEALKICKSTCVITELTETHFYQTTSTLKKQKTNAELVQIAGVAKNMVFH